MLTDRKIPKEYKDRIRILVVEDNILSQKLAGFMIKQWGFKYDIALNGKVAIELMKLNTYDLVLMDVEMPEMDGYEATEFIRNKLNLGIPIIATTSHSSEKEREKCLLAGMTDYLTKPIKEEEFFNMVTNYLFITVVENVENNKSGSPERAI